MKFFVTETQQREHNDKLIDLCYDVAVRVCRRAEGFPDNEPWNDWELPSRAEFRKQVRAARIEQYRRAVPRHQQEGQ